MILQKVGPQPDDFLGDIAAIGKDGDLADQVTGLDCHPLVLHQGPNPFDQAFLVRLHHQGAAVGNPPQAAFDQTPQRLELLGHGLALPGPGGLQLVERHGGHAGNLRPVVVRIAGGRPHLLDNPGQGQQCAQANRALAGSQPGSQQFPELVAITAQGHGVEPVVLGLPGPVDPDADLHRPPPHFLPDQVLQLRLQRP